MVRVPQLPPPLLRALQKMVVGTRPFSIGALTKLFRAFAGKPQGGFHSYYAISEHLFSSKPKMS